MTARTGNSRAARRPKAGAPPLTHFSLGTQRPQVGLGLQKSLNRCEHDPGRLHDAGVVGTRARW